MTEPFEATSLRPLSIGELLDRAVTLFVRNFWLFCGLAAIVYVPLALVQSLLGDFWMRYAATLSSIFNAHGKVPDIPTNAAMLQRVNIVSLFELVIWLIAAPFASAALTYAAAKLVEGRPASFWVSVRFALSRWPGVLLLLVLGMFLVGAVFIAGYLGLAMLAVLAALVLRSVALGVVLGLFVLVAWLAVITVSFVAAGVGFVTFIVEPVNPLRAFAAGLERVINRASLWRSLLVGLVYVAVSAGFSIVAYAAGFGLLFTLHTGIPLLLIAAIVSVVQLGFSVLIGVLYYYDLRARREGADLAALVSHVAASH